MTTYEAEEDWEILEALDERGERLTGWEIDFLEGLWKKLEDSTRGFLTPGERKKLEEIAKERLPSS